MFYRNALHIACWDDRIEIAKVLIEYNIDWQKEAGWWGKTPMQVCEDRDAHNMIALLKSMMPTTTKAPTTTTAAATSPLGLSSSESSSSSEFSSSEFSSSSEYSSSSDISSASTHDSSSL